MSKEAYGMLLDSSLLIDEIDSRLAREIAGISWRQQNYWVKNGLLASSFRTRSLGRGKGSVVFYSPTVVGEFLLIKHSLSTGSGMQGLKRMRGLEPNAPSDMFSVLAGYPQPCRKKALVISWSASMGDFIVLLPKLSEDGCSLMGRWRSPGACQQFKGFIAQGLRSSWLGLGILSLESDRRRLQKEVKTLQIWKSKEDKELARMTLDAEVTVRKEVISCLDCILQSTDV